MPLPMPLLMLILRQLSLIDYFHHQLSILIS
jgi:hypothetical protein